MRLGEAGIGNGEPTGIFDGMKALSAAGDPLDRRAQVIDFEGFRGDLERALSRSDRARGGQIIDATVIEARRPRLTQAERDTIKVDGERMDAGAARPDRP
jgi:hypothetical protein